MKDMPGLAMLAAAVLPVAALAALLMALTGAWPVHAAPQGVWAVCPAAGTGCDFTSIQQAIAVAQPGDVVRVVGPGVYTENLVITKSIKLYGGCANTACNPQWPNVFVTTIDGGGNGRAITIRGEGQVITPVVYGFHITGGDATGESDHPHWGGGIGSWDAAPIVSFNTITNNVATHNDDSPYACGGGIALLNPGPGTLVLDNDVYSNTADGDVTGLWSGRGGGIAVISGTAVLQDNDVYSNLAHVSPDYRKGYGGGIYVISATVTITHNNVLDNRAATGGDGYGGGIYLGESDGLVTNNLLWHNLGSRDYAGWGGGLGAESCDPLTLTGNVVYSNTASLAGNGDGGGLYLDECRAVLVGENVVMDNLGSQERLGFGGVRITGSDVALSCNRILSNTGSIAAQGHGGLYLYNTTATLDSDLIVANVGTLSPTASTYENGMWVTAGTVLTATNIVVARNGLPGRGRGVYLQGSIGSVTVTLVNSTVVSNTVEGIACNGVYSVTLVNLILWGNEDDLDGCTATYSDVGDGDAGTGNISSDPLFVDAANNDFHLRPDSPCIDRGASPVTYTLVPDDDWDGDSRPIGGGYDMGIDEVWKYVYLPLVLKS